jgi:sodium transport system permease protein
MNENEHYQSTAPMAPLRTTLGGRPRWREIAILYRREMRASLREKTIVINTILMPILLYPLIMWAAFSGLMFVMGQTEGFVSRIVVREWPAGHAQLRNRLERDEKIKLVEAKDASDPERLIREGTLDALVEVLPVEGEAAVFEHNFKLRVTYNKSKERSDGARERITTAVQRYREEWLKREATARGIDAASWQGFSVERRNVATGKQVGRLLLGLMLPLFFVIMVAIGCFYPAVDSTAGERERNTWETLMSTAASRTSIVTAKYLVVASLGCLAGVLNLTAMLVTMRPIMAPLLAQADESIEFTVPVAAIPVLALAAVLLAGFIAAGMMIFASFARTFKEGQAMITPFYMLILLPIMFLQVPGIKLTVPLACIPIVNVTLMVREAILGTFHWLQIGITLAVSIALVAGAIALATFVLQFEDVVVGSYGGSLGKFLKERVVGGKAHKPAPEVTR